MPNLPANSRPLYRILSEKSRPGFGKYADFTVSDILKVQPRYVAWMYFNNPQISFKEDILEKVAIRERIAKPGVDVDAFRRWQKQQREGLTPEQIRNGIFKMARNLKRKRIASMMRDKDYNKTLTREKLQALNHGHFKES